MCGRGAVSVCGECSFPGDMWSERKMGSGGGRSGSRVCVCVVSVCEVSVCVVSVCGE